MSVIGEVGFKVAFLRTMLPVMNKDDVATFEKSCSNLLNRRRSPDALLADVENIRKLYSKFEEQRGSNAKQEDTKVSAPSEH